MPMKRLDDRECQSIKTRLNVVLTLSLRIAAVMTAPIPQDFDVGIAFQRSLACEKTPLFRWWSQMNSLEDY